MAIKFLSMLLFYTMSMLILTTSTAIAYEKCGFGFFGGGINCDKNQCIKVKSKTDKTINIKCQKCPPKSDSSDCNIFCKMVKAATEGACQPGFYIEAKKEWMVIYANDSSYPRFECECYTDTKVHCGFYLDDTGC